MQVKSIIREFLVNCSIKSYSKRTIKSYRNNLTRFFDQTNETELENITSLIIKQQIAELQSKGLIQPIRGTWSFKDFENMLKNRKYIGEWYFNGELENEHGNEPI